ncbi:hypothetical protein [Paraburkholderia terrae]|uniref:Uncharacterized protein n=1 Tax=Paraburkholderia terrae TaxID=311230 RepID=A0A2I8F1M6_9BURK|nr:hypothetical protein [Paraburkholderia terrae]AUT64934.1 hypothetical protein C2L65_35590 [Paraburkholderia terrae]
MFISVAKDIATLLAALAALLYFGYKVFAGWLLLNLTVNIESERQALSGEDDHLVVKIALAKGKVDSVRLLAAELQLTTPERSDITPVTRMIGSMERLRFPLGERAQWNERDSGNPTLTLSTEETMNLCEHFRVMSGIVYRIEVVVQGDRFRDRLLPSLSQWRGAAIALPTKFAEM